jgi:hypothetical protein
MGGPDDLTPLDEFDNCQIILEGGLTLPCAGKEPSEVPLGALDRNGPWGDVARAWDEALERLRSAEPANQQGSEGSASPAAPAAPPPVTYDPRFAQEASEIDKWLTRDLLKIARMLYDETLPIEIRAKVLSVVLLRGGSYPMRDLEGEHAANSVPFWINVFPLGGLDDHEVAERILCQKLAVDAVLNGDPALFNELSKGDEGEHLPSHRRPATQLMHILLQDGGLKSGYDGQNQVQKWIEGLPPETAGRAMYHMYDAAQSKDFGAGFRITGLGASAGPVGFEFQGEYAGDHWAEATRNVSDGAGAAFGGRSADDKQLMARGFAQANTSFGSVVLSDTK